MKKNLLYLFAMLLSFGVFTGCNDDDEQGNGEELAGEIAGTYLGILNVSLDKIPFDPIEQQIYISQEDRTTAKLELKDFSIAVGEGVLEVGDIVIPNVKLEGNASSVALLETKTTINHPVLGELEVTASGTVVSGVADLTIAVYAKTLKQNINVAFKGDKVNSEVKDHALDVAAWYARQELTITGGEVENKYPSDGLLVTYKGFNKITIASTPFSFLPKTAYITVESADVVQKADGIYILPFEKTFDYSTMKGINMKLSGKITDGVLVLNMELSTADNTLKYTFTGGAKRTGATIDKMTLASDAVRVQPEISEVASNKADIAFYVTQGTTVDKLKSVVPTFEISEGATISLNDAAYVAGTPVDFSTTQVFKVKAESGRTTYTYTVAKNEWVDYDFKHNLDTWETKNTGATGDDAYQQYQEPANGWSTSNEGVKFIKAMFPSLYAIDKPYVVVPSDDSKSGKAARVETAYTTGMFVWITSIPVVTSGTVYNGAFIVDMANTLKSTKFGYPCLKQPVAFKGSYKYTPGTVYYTCPDPDPKKAHIANIDKNKTDVPAMNAVFYEVNSYAFDFLDGTNLLTSHKVVAVASVDGKAQSSYTDFNATFKFRENKTFDPAKKYKLAIVCSSSKDGDKFSGAPGSVLFVDNLEVTF